MNECRHEYGSDEQGVQQDAQADDDANLGQYDHREHREDSENGSEQDAGAGDHPSGDGQGD